MMNILDFIDSPDIREHNINTIFTPSEQAVIIYNSYKKSVEEKISALRFLVNNYNEDEFQQECINELQCEDISTINFRDIVSDTANTWQNALNLRYDNNEAVFLVEITNRYTNNEIKKYFSDYNSAYNFITIIPKSIYDCIEIIRIPMNAAYQGYTFYLFNAEMLMYDVQPYFEDFENPESESFSKFSIKMPLPFKTGDILKAVRPSMECVYGVLDHTYDGNTDNIYLRLEKYIYDNKLFTWERVNYFRLQKVSPEELPQKQNYLKLLSDIRRGKLDCMEFMSIYSLGLTDSFIDSYEYIW